MAVVHHSNAIRQSLKLRSAYVAGVTSDTFCPIQDSEQVARRLRALPQCVAPTHGYLCIVNDEGRTGWSTPLGWQWSDKDSAALATVASLVKGSTSIEDANLRLTAQWETEPLLCAAVDTALWDLVCKTADIPLHRALSGGEANFPPVFYGSILGLRGVDLDALRAVRADGFQTVKLDLPAPLDLPGLLRTRTAASLPGGALALDAHGMLPSLQTIGPILKEMSLAWLEDPFLAEDNAKWSRHDASSTTAPPLVVGETSWSPQTLCGLSDRRCVYALNLELALLGITRVVWLLEWLRARGRCALIHGRALLPACHFAAAWGPEVVAGVEINLPFASERVATLRVFSGTQAVRTAACGALQLAGVGCEPMADLIRTRMDVFE